MERIGDFLSARSLLAQLIDRLIEHYKMLIIIQLNQYFYAREGENQSLVDYRPPARRNTDSFWQIFRFFKSNDPSLKILAPPLKIGVKGFSNLFIKVSRG